MLSISIAFNALSNHGTCTAVFVAVAFIVIFALSSLQTLGRISWLAMIGVVSIIVAGKSTTRIAISRAKRRASDNVYLVFIVTISVGVQDQPVTAPRDVKWQSDYKLFGSPSFTECMAAISSVIFAYAGTGAFFPIVSEMRDPKLYTRALILCQTVVSIVYLTVGIVVYYYCGSYVASPALGSAGTTIKKVSYGIALPGLLVSGILLAHVSHQGQ